MPRLISKDDDLKRSAPVIGFEILKLLHENKHERVSIFDVAEKLHQKNKAGGRSIYYGILFLYSLDLIDFNEPYIVVHHAED